MNLAESTKRGHISMPHSRTSEVQNGGDRIFKKLMLVLTFGKIWARLGQSDTDGLGTGETQFHWEEGLANSIRKKASPAGEIWITILDTKF